MKPYRPRRRARDFKDRHVRHDEPRRADGREQATNLVFGVEPIRELLAAAPDSIRTLHLRDTARFAAEIDAVRASGGEVTIVDDAALSRMAGAAARHQGLVAIIREYDYAPLESVLAEAPDPLVVVDGVTDPRNLGAIFRSAEGAGARAIILARDRTGGVTPAAIKSSAGAWVHMRIARCGNVTRTLETLKQRGYWIAALAAEGDRSIYDLDVSRKLALVIGSEGRGVRELVKKTADFIVSIPMRGKVASLNVSVATAVALYEIARRRTAQAQHHNSPR